MTGLMHVIRINLLADVCLKNRLSYGQEREKWGRLHFFWTRPQATLRNWINRIEGIKYGWYNLEIDAKPKIESCLDLTEGWICLNHGQVKTDQVTPLFYVTMIKSPLDFWVSICRYDQVTPRALIIVNLISKAGVKWLVQLRGKLTQG